MIIFLYGPDTFRSRRKLNEIKQRFINVIDKSSLNIAELDGAKLEVNDFETAIATPPFLAKKRMVIITDLIAKNKGQKIQKDILERLSKNRLETTILVFWEGDLGEGKKKRRRSKTSERRSNLLFSRLTEEKYAQEFELLDLPDVKRFAVTEATARQATIQPAALERLVDLTGNDLWRLDSELNKLIAFAAGKPITKEMVQTIVESRLDEDIFQLTDALGRKDKTTALKLINHQLRSGTSPTELLGRIIWQTKNLLLLKSFVEVNGSGYQAERLTYQLGLHPFVIKKTLGQLDNHQLEDLKNTYRHLLAIDHQLKTSQTDAEALFDLLVVRS